MNYVVFTQDIGGEREWLTTQLPGCVNFETIYSGAWPSDQPIDGPTDSIWEVPPDYKDDTSSWAGKKIKSLFDPAIEIVDDRWLDADELLLDPNHFGHGPRSDKCLVIHVPRSGTWFLESILKNHCMYEQLVGWAPTWATPRKVVVDGVELGLWRGDHDIPHSPKFISESGEAPGKIQIDLIKKHKPDVFFTYRNDWWGCLTSNVIVPAIGLFHNTFPSAYLPSDPCVKITEEDLSSFTKQIGYIFNNLCYMRSIFRNINFYIFEYSNLIKNQNLTEHKKLNYDKRKIISNYDEMETVFNQMYSPTLNLWEQRFLNHVTKMKCRIPINFDEIYSKHKYA